MDIYRVPGYLHDGQAGLFPLASRGAHNFPLKSLQIVLDNTKNTIMIFNAPQSSDFFSGGGPQGWSIFSSIWNLTLALDSFSQIARWFVKSVWPIRLAKVSLEKRLSFCFSPSRKFPTCADELPTQTWWCQRGLCPCTWTGDAPSGRGC